MSSSASTSILCVSIPYILWCAPCLWRFIGASYLKHELRSTEMYKTDPTQHDLANLEVFHLFQQPKNLNLMQVECKLYRN